MPLPILHTQQATPNDLMRLFQKTELHWGRHVAEETVLDAGTALANPQLPNIWDANRMLDVALPEGTGAHEAFAEAQAHFQKQGTQCWSWTMAAGAREAQTRPMVDFLLSHGYAEDGFDVFYLAEGSRGDVHEVPGLKIIPARASFKHYRELAQEWAGEYGTPDFVDGVMLHLDDPHVDALVAIKDQKAAAFVAVLSVGEIGGIQEMFVTPLLRGQGIGRTMMSRAMEICARSLFKHVFVGVGPENAAAVGLYSKIGFKRIGRHVQYRAPK